jgi:predicted transcriptional regulator
MQLKEIINILSCNSKTSETLLDKDINYVYAADMMSDVLKSCKIGSLLITGLVNQQVLQVSEIMDLQGIIFVSGKEPGAEMIEEADCKNIPLLTTDKHMFEVCGILYSNGMRGKEIQQKEENGGRDTLQSVIPDKR